MLTFAPMKWFTYPIAVVAYCIFAAMLVAGIFNGFNYSQFWFWAVGAALLFLVAAFLLTKVSWSDEGKVALQIALCLAPLILMSNFTENKKKQVRLFVVPENYTGKLQITFVSPREMKQTSKSDSVVVVFDENGKTFSSDDYRRVMRDMENHLCYRSKSGKITPIMFADQDKRPADTAQLVCTYISSDLREGRLSHLYYNIDKAGRIPVSK